MVAQRWVQNTVQRRKIYCKALEWLRHGCYHGFFSQLSLIFIVKEERVWRRAFCLSEINKPQTFHVPVAPNVFRTSVQLHSLPCLIRNWLDLQSWQIPWESKRSIRRIKGDSMVWEDRNLPAYWMSAVIAVPGMCCVKALQLRHAENVKLERALGDDPFPILAGSRSSAGSSPVPCLLLLCHWAFVAAGICVARASCSWGCLHDFHPPAMQIEGVWKKVPLDLTLTCSQLVIAWNLKC